MAIQDIIKCNIFCPATELGNVLERIQLWGKLEIISADNITTEVNNSVSHEITLKLSYIIDLIEEQIGKPSAMKILTEGIPDVKLEELNQYEKEVDIENEYCWLRQLDKSIKQGYIDTAEIDRQIRVLRSIKDLPLSGNKMKYKTTDIVIGRAEKGLYDQLNKESKIVVELIRDSDKPIIAVIFLKENSEYVKKMISGSAFHKIEIPSIMTPSERIFELEKRKETIICEIDEHKQKVHDKGVELIEKFRALKDFYENKTVLEDASIKSLKTKKAAAVRGWIESEKKNELKKVLKGIDVPLYIEYSDPEKDENPPVILSNSKFATSYEVVTDLYGTPAYDWIDPTPYVAPFFALFFGICMTDAGYGILISAACLWALIKFKLGTGARKFITMMLWGGIASIITGALTGGWFGNAAEGFELINKMKIIDPLEKPQYFLYFSVVLGYIQVVFGVIISIMQNIKRKMLKTAFFEDFPWILILISIPAIFAGGIVTVMAKAVLSLGLVGIVFFSGHQSKNIFARIGAGLYNLYGGTDYFKDMISYSRLFALGMGTGILAMAINEISRFVIELLGIIGYIIVPFILVIGHLVINLLMSMLSAYVHTSRLQYVEFFTKFFKGGGKNFEPFCWKNKMINLSR